MGEAPGSSDGSAEGDADGEAAGDSDGDAEGDFSASSELSVRAAGCTRTGAIVAGAEGVAAGTGVFLVSDASSPSAGTADGAGVWEAAGVGDVSLSGVQPSAAVSFAASAGLSTASP